MVLKENQRLERMMGDISAYTAMFQKDPELKECDLAQHLDSAHQWVLARGLMQGVEWRPVLAPGYDKALCDPQDLEAMLRYVLENAAEAADQENPVVVAASGPDEDPSMISLAISNNGRTPEPMDMEDILSPFHSSKPRGTGLGLPIASLAARRSLGNLRLEPNPQGGAVCRLSLPAPFKD